MMRSNKTNRAVLSRIFLKGAKNIFLTIRNQALEDVLGNFFLLKAAQCVFPLLMISQKDHSKHNKVK